MSVPRIVTCLVLISTFSTRDASAAGADAAVASASDFVREPADVTASPGSTVQLDCELSQGHGEDICAWRVHGTHIGVDNFYNVYPPPKVRALFPDHMRVCSIVIEDIDWKYDGLWTCWPLGIDSHLSSRAARVIVSGGTTASTPEPPVSTTPFVPTTSWTPPHRSTTPAPEPSTTPAPPITTTAAPPTTARTTTAPGPGFQCPEANGLFADPRDGSHYYVCIEWMAIRMQCEGSQRWDDAAKSCR